ncbi:hypothetical protein ERO13_D12G019850v2 [Gossypium hirsutum]|uniref:Uncharacterized protein n=4 Tax=Gossypium TaxID=3633 RepID=A0A5J5NTA3_GOSBA|nr:hypothetical protein ES319_D12G021200v1 [Gossypium barbadense]KAG4114027.1 hypothetical protein ERO13_D12G019850v2 [Gossypium hirsutum]TYG39525.1 hypothetical protein ES288_D12G021900v1 [Gossypium darwinii]TYH37175.1 hypothetical protein ES332_D12G021400v1 [Gossypium tomentosum]TYI49236.1 hypothetical protein E1A91_D12G020600v1 [Gossypium mustelinum]
MKQTKKNQMSTESNNQQQWQYYHTLYTNVKTGGRLLIDGQKNKTADCIACTQPPPKQALRRRFFCRVGAWRLQS